MKEDDRYKQLPPGLQRLYREILDDDMKASGETVHSTAARHARLSRLVSEYLSREQESLQLYEQLDHLAAFHASEAPERVLRGSNRSGKTITAAIEFARAVTSADPYGKYPSSDGRAFIVGKDEKHNSEVLYRKLFRPGAFYVIRDKVTGKERAYRPWEPEDKARKDEARRADPLMPPRMIVDISWENKKESCPSLVTLVNGWEIRFFSSKGKPPQGSDIDLAWFDEEIIDCLSGFSELYDPVQGRYRRIDQIKGDWHVHSLNPETGKVEIRRAMQPFVKRESGEIIRASLSNGEQIYATRRHKILSASGRWLSVQEAFSLGVAVRGFSFPLEPARQSTLHSCKSAPAREPCASGKETLADSLKGSESRVFCGALTGPLDSSVECREQSASCGPFHKRLQIASQSSSSRFVDREQRAFGPELAETLKHSVFSMEENIVLETLIRSSQPVWGLDTFLQSSLPREFGTYDAALPTGETKSLPVGTPFVCEPTCDGLGLLAQDFQSHCFGGLHPGGGRVRASEACDPSAFPSRVDVPESGRSSMRQGGRAPTALHNPPASHSDRQELVRGEPSEEPVFVKSIEPVGEYPVWDFTVPGTWNYINGKICNHNSEWYNEIAARLIDREGKFFWSATAQLGGPQLFDLCEQAERLRGDPDARVVEVFAHIKDNPHFTDDQRELFFSKMTDEQMRIRVEGEFAFTSHRIWPEFDEKVQGSPWFQIPNSWTRFTITDPGRQVCAVLFAAVPPPSDPRSGHCFIYDELYLTNCTAKRYGQAMREKTQGQQIQEHIIDHQGGKITDIASGMNVESQYAAALKQNGVKSVATGYSFIWGSNDLAGGIEKVSSWLLIRDNSDSYLKIFVDKLPNFCWEVKRYHYKKVGGKITDKPDKRNDHTPDCLRYLAMRDPKWVKPRRRRPTGKGILDRIQEKRKKHQKGGGVSLGPSSGKKPDWTGA